MVLKYYKLFLDNPNITNFNNFIANINELKLLKLNKNELNNIVTCIKDKHLSNNNTLLIKKDRKGPPFSATCFPVGISLPSNNKLWTVVKLGKSNIWKMTGDYDYQLTFDKDFIKSFVINKHILKTRKLTKVTPKMFLSDGTLHIGEYSINKEKITPGYYNIYTLAGSLIIAPEKITTDGLFKLKWSAAGYNIAVDGGTFGFHNGKIITDMLNILSNDTKNNKSKNSKRKSKSSSIYLPYEYIEKYDFKKMNTYGYATLYGKDMKDLDSPNLDQYITNNNLQNTLTSVYCSNNYGDGFFPVFKSDNAFIIMSYQLYNEMNYIDFKYFYEPPE